MLEIDFHPQSCVEVINSNLRSKRVKLYFNTIIWMLFNLEVDKKKIC